MTEVFSVLQERSEEQQIWHFFRSLIYSLTLRKICLNKGFSVFEP